MKSIHFSLFKGITQTQDSRLNCLEFSRFKTQAFQIKRASIFNACMFLYIYTFTYLCVKLRYLTELKVIFKIGM